MKARVPFATLLPVLLLAWLTGCGEERGSLNEYPVALAEGTYRVTFGQGYRAADEALLLTVTARLDRATNQDVHIPGPRPRMSEWGSCCALGTPCGHGRCLDLSRRGRQASLQVQPESGPPESKRPRLVHSRRWPHPARRIRGLAGAGREVEPDSQGEPPCPLVRREP
jgi:hypothetical protein